MTRKSKKVLTRKVVMEVVENYDYSQKFGDPVEELISIEDQRPFRGIRSLFDMATYIENFHSENLFDFDRSRKPYPSSGCLENTVIHGVDSS